MAGKGFNAKAFLVNHTEKVILGIVVLMSLAFIGGAQWSSYKGTPAEITEKVAVGKAALNNHSWPEEEQKKYELVQEKLPTQQVHDILLSPISPQAYAFSTRFVTSPWQGKEPLREPTLLKLQGALASASQALIERQSSTSPFNLDGTPLGDPDSPNGAVPGSNTPANPDNATFGEENDEFASNRSMPQQGGGVTGLGGGGLRLGRGDDGEMGVGGLTKGGVVGRPPRSPGQKGAAKRSTRQGDDDPQGGLRGMGAGGLGVFGRGGMDVEDGLGQAVGAVREAQPYKFAIIRAVFPIKEQIALYMQATNSMSMEAAAQLFEVIDFNLERQEQVGRTDQWTDWEPVDTQAALDVLEQSGQPEADVVRATVTDSAITMPLPPRIYGRWGKLASHPRILGFELSPQEIEQEVKLNAELMKMREEQEKNQVKDERQKVQKRGFSSVASDARSLQSQVLGGGMDDDGEMGFGRGMGAGRGDNGKSRRGNRPGSLPNRPGATNGQDSQAAYAVLMERLSKTKDDAERNKAMAEYIRKSVTAEGELLLFRYIDFNVDPGKTYRYRVRLILNNPNFGHLTSEANGEASVVAGETRPTDWSDVTEPVTIERDVAYFVKDVDLRRNTTLMSLYEWDTKLGTTVHGDVDLYPGQRITGVAKTNVIDPAKSVAEVKPYTFKSPDVFVDTHSDVALDRNLHKDLRLPGGSNGEALLPEEALVFQATTGELAVVDPVREAKERARLESRQKAQDEFFAWMSQPVGGAVGAPGLNDDDGEGGFGRIGGAAARLRNPLSAAGGGRGGKKKLSKGD